MGSLFGAVGTALSSLAAEQSALNVTSNNIANAQTPGYTRESVVFQESAPLQYGSLTLGTGVSAGQVQSQRNPVLQLRIDDETQRQASLSTYVNSLQSVQGSFSSSGGDIGSQITQFFNGLQQLSTDPTNTTVRSSVLGSAQNLANAFHSSVQQLNNLQTNVDLNVTQTVTQINALTSQIAQLNGQVQSLQNLGQDGGGLTDQRDQLIQQLSGLIDLSVIRSDNNGISLTTKGGAALVSTNQSFALSTQVGSNSLQQVFSQGSNITNSVSGGQLGGLVQVRDQAIPSLLTSLDTLASGLSSAVNTANATGFDLNGNAGGNVFTPPPAGSKGAAGSLQVAITDPRLIAASSDGTPGNSGNLQNLLAVQNQAVAGGQTPIAFYSSLVGTVGNDVAGATAEQSASQLVLQQLKDQLSSSSGVNLDEEASNLVTYQRGYQAAAQVINDINQLLGVVLNLGIATTV